MMTSYGTVKVMAMEMYFMAALSGNPTATCRPTFRPLPTIFPANQAALPRHFLVYRRLQGLTALSKARLSEILNVDRRTPYFWEKGGNIDPDNEAHLEKVLSVLASVGQVPANLMRKSIMAINKKGLSSADYLRERRYQDAGKQLAAALANQGNSTLTAPLLGHRSMAQLLELEEDADQGVLPSTRAPKRLNLPLKAPVRRA